MCVCLSSTMLYHHYLTASCGLNNADDGCRRKSRIVPCSVSYKHHVFVSHARAVCTYQCLQIDINDTCDPVNRLFYIDMSSFDGESVSTLGPMVKLVDTFENKYSYITNEGRTFWFLSNLNAPR